MSSLVIHFQFLILTINMACGSCGTGGTGGCSSGGCATGGCNKLNTFDWLGNMLPPTATEINNVYEIRFKNTHKGFYRNVNGLRLAISDWVVVEGDRGGFDIGQISLGGVLAQLQAAKKGVLQSENYPKIYRKANDIDIEQMNHSREREPSTIQKARAIITDLRLDMKLSDVEFQGDGTKATFYYIADARVDFRELIKLLAKEFKIRVEMKQIGLRHEAALVGGIGVCGRELCCATWLTEFKVVTTAAARYQNLSLNPAKISGLCGRLKCCLNYELDAYKDALKDFPHVESLLTERGKVSLQKTDIFRKKMWFSYEGETSWYSLDVANVKEFIALNKKGIAIPPLSNEVVEESDNDNRGNDKMGFIDGVGQNGSKNPRNDRENRDRNREQKPNRLELKGNKPQGRKEAPKNELVRKDAPKSEPVRREITKNEPIRKEPPVRNEPQRQEPQRREAPKNQPPRKEIIEKPVLRNAPPRNEPVVRNEPPHNEPPHNDTPPPPIVKRADQKTPPPPPKKVPPPQNRNSNNRGGTNNTRNNNNNLRRR